MYFSTKSVFRFLFSYVLVCRVFLYLLRSFTISYVFIPSLEITFNSQILHYFPVDLLSDLDVSNSNSTEVSITDNVFIFAHPLSLQKRTILAKSSGTLCIFLIRTEHSPPFSPKQCWFLGELHAVTEKFFVHNNAKCLRNRPTLF